MNLNKIYRSNSMLLVIDII